MAGDFKPIPRKKTMLDHNKLHLRSPNATGQVASLQWQLVNSNPRIVVWTNDPNDTIDFGKINANMDAPCLFALFRLIEQTANHEGPIKNKIDNMNFTFPGGKRSDSPSVVSSTIVAKGDDGLISIMISAPRRPQIKFAFINPEFHHFVHTDGTPFEKAEASKLFALAYCDMLKLIYSNMMVKEYVEPPPKEDRNGGGGGNYQQRQGGGGGQRQGGGGGGGGGGNRAPAATAEITEDDMGGW